LLNVLVLRTKTDIQGIKFPMQDWNIKTKIRVYLEQIFLENSTKIES
jgi:hypothetical protein